MQIGDKLAGLLTCYDDAVSAGGLGFESLIGQMDSVSQTASTFLRSSVAMALTAVVDTANRHSNILA